MHTIASPNFISHIASSITHNFQTIYSFSLFSQWTIRESLYLVIMFFMKLPQTWPISPQYISIVPNRAQNLPIFVQWTSRVEFYEFHVTAFLYHSFLYHFFFCYIRTKKAQTAWICRKNDESHFNMKHTVSRKNCR